MTITIHYCQWCAAVYDDATITECENCHSRVSHFPLKVPGANLQEQDKAERNYRSMIRSMVRGLWSGILDIDQAFDAGATGIQLFLTQAWNAGLQSVGVLPSEQSPEQRIELQQIINNEVSRLFAFLLDIEAGSKANGGKLAPQMARADMWILRARDTENRARVTAQTDPKLEWLLGPTDVSCVDCLRFDKKVKRASTWRRSGVHPQGRMLDCKGYNCLCQLLPTTKPLSRGPLPRLSSA